MTNSLIEALDKMHEIYRNGLYIVDYSSVFQVNFSRNLGKYGDFYLHKIRYTPKGIIKRGTFKIVNQDELIGILKNQ